MQIDEELDPDDVVLFDLLYPVKQEREAKAIGAQIAKLIARLFGGS